MKIKNNFHIVITISVLMIALSISISLINFMVSLHSTETDLKTRSLPLTVDNIYTEIQKHVIEPNLVASMMAHDTFLKDWLINDEQNSEKITRYLVANAGDAGGQRYSSKLLKGVALGSAPQRITELPKWVREHRKVPDWEWRHKDVRTKANCVACHTGAEQGYYDE